MLTTDRLLIRRAKLGDLADVHAFMSNAAAMAYWDTPPHSDIATTRKLVRGLTRNKSVALYFVFEHQSRVIGMGGMHSKNEIGYMLHPDFWRQGFMREAFEVIIPHIWEVTENTALRAEVDPRNTASVAFIESLGFQETHRKANTFCIGGVWSDSIFYSLNRPAHLAGQRPS